MCQQSCLLSKEVASIFLFSQIHKYLLSSLSPLYRKYLATFFRLTVPFVRVSMCVCASELRVNELLVQELLIVLRLQLEGFLSLSLISLSLSLSLSLTHALTLTHSLSLTHTLTTR